MKYLLTLLLVLLVGCDYKPSQAEKPSKAEIKALCKSVGDKAFALADDGSKNYRSLQWIEQGAAAECELKYLSGK
jgi:hypothetical protein